LGEDLFFLENAFFWDKKAVQVRRRLFLENADFWDKNVVQIR